MLTGLAQTHKLVPKSCWRSSDWPMHSELGCFARSLISGLNDGAVTFKPAHAMGTHLLCQHSFNHNYCFALCCQFAEERGQEEERINHQSFGEERPRQLQLSERDGRRDEWIDGLWKHGRVCNTFFWVKSVYLFVCLFVCLSIYLPDIKGIG